MKESIVVYWMSRAIRVDENPALVEVCKTAKEHGAKVIVVFALIPNFPYANTRNMDFLLKGLVEVSDKLAKKGIPLLLYQGHAIDAFEYFQDKYHIHAIINEHHVLKPFLSSQEKVREWCLYQDVDFVLVNTACVVPVEEASGKLEFAAKTIRSKITNKYKGYLDEINLSYSQHMDTSGRFTIDQIETLLGNYPQLKLSKLTPGEEAANQVLSDFIENGLDNYDLRNRFDSKGQSYLSAYLHFGMISPVKMIREVEKTNHRNAPLFVEEAMVRRELAENYCHYQKKYDSLQGAWPWAIATLSSHLNDPREYIYTKEQFEKAQTHDDLWNACQCMVVEDGYLHSYLRMYWAKMVLLWTKHPQDAIDILIYLNDTYFLDGRDPNGYTGIMWCVAGVHDRPWFNRPIIGLIRAMGKDGTLKKTKFDPRRLKHDI
ncbi:MAG: deoxyribodipyrimidine photolyase [Firmicutes bacterium HGW-Firmicutes-20]|jgi:deoxyribodipyrimidine photo-lyase|nr:MAG: deoxyribodipyrimidine photolyase [Firmicutes bacterium HGW-Firmicutes-20]PKM66049.1 MAG: deoxyribodipyrimidine photolyase [Firmicutes bacterium HGW-Firmicutes-19]